MSNATRTLTVTTRACAHHKTVALDADLRAAERRFLAMLGFARWEVVLHWSAPVVWR
jgi:hypothetical protein